MAWPLRGRAREGGKGRAIQEKRTFYETFLFSCHLKIKIIQL